MNRLPERKNARSAHKLIWTPEMVKALQSLRARGEPLVFCAERIGVDRKAANAKAQQLGIAGRMNQGRRPGRAVYGCLHTDKLVTRQSAAFNAAMQRQKHQTQQAFSSSSQRLKGTVLGAVRRLAEATAAQQEQHMNR